MLILCLYTLIVMAHAQFNIQLMNRCLGNCSVCQPVQPQVCRDVSACMPGYQGPTCNVKPTMANFIALFSSDNQTLPSILWKNNSKTQCSYTNTAKQKKIISVLGLYSGITNNSITIDIRPNYQNYILHFNIIRNSWTPFQDFLDIFIRDQSNNKLVQKMIEVEQRDEISPLTNVLRCKNDQPTLIEKYQIQGLLNPDKIKKITIQFKGQIQRSSSFWGITNIKITFGCSKFLLLSNNECNTCIQGFYQKKQGNITIGCQPCPINCISCTSNSFCKQCIFDFKLSNGKCQTKLNFSLLSVPDRSKNCSNSILLQSISSASEQVVQKQFTSLPPHKRVRLVFYLYYVPQQFVNTDKVSVFVDGKEQTQVSGLSLKGNTSKPKESCSGFGEKEYYSIYKIVTPYFEHTLDKMNLSIKTVNKRKMALSEIGFEYQYQQPPKNVTPPTPPAPPAPPANNTNPTVNNTNDPVKPPNNTTPLPLPPTLPNTTTPANPTPNPNLNNTNNSITPVPNPNPASNSTPSNPTPSPNSSLPSNSTPPSNQTPNTPSNSSNPQSPSNNTNPPNSNSTNDSIPSNSTNNGTSPAPTPTPNNTSSNSNTNNTTPSSPAVQNLTTFVKQLQKISSQFKTGIKQDKDLVVCVQYPVEITTQPYFYAEFMNSNKTLIPISAEMAPNRQYQQFKFYLQDSLMNQTINLYISDRSPVKVAGRYLQAANNVKISQMYVPRYDKLSQQEWTSISRYATFYQILSWFTILTTIILQFFGSSIITQKFSLVLQIIFLHIYIYSEYLPLNFKYTIAGLQRMENLDYFQTHVENGIESFLLGNVVQLSPYKFSVFNKDVNFTRMIYPCVIISLLYLIWHILLNIVRIFIQPSLVVSEIEQERTHAQKFKLFLIRIAQRYLNFWYQVWQYMYITIIWAACLQFHNMRYPLNANRSEVMNMIFCFVVLVIAVLLPIVTFIYLNKKYFRLDYFEYSYWYQNIFFLKLPEQSLPSNHHRIFILIRNFRYILLVVCFAYLADYPIQALIIIMFAHLLSLIYMLVTHIEIRPFNSKLNILQHCLLIILAILMIIAYGVSKAISTSQYMILGHVLTTCCLLLTIVGLVRVAYYAYCKFKDGVMEKELSQFKPAIGTERIV